MPPSRKTEMAFMGMMEKFFENHTTCDCPDCRKSLKPLRTISSRLSTKDGNKDGPSLSATVSCSDIDSHFCPDHRPPSQRRTVPKENEREKDKTLANASASQLNRADKINRLLKADSIPAVLEVFKSTPTTAEENKLATEIQDATAQCKLFAESKVKIISFCNDESVNSEAVYGLLAKFRQERSILTSAIIKSNTEREKSLQAIHEVNDLMGMLRDVAKEGKGPSGEDVRHNLGSMIFKIHELAKNPSSLHDELLDLRDEHFDLLADHDEQTQKFMDIESCHEKLHEDKKKLQEDLAWEKREHLETKKRLSSLSGTKNEVNQAHKSLEKVHEENADLKREVEKLMAELAKINALKHENTQLKKKLAVSEATKPEPKVEATPTDAAQSNKKKKGRKATAAATTSAESASNADTGLTQKTEQVHEKEIKALQQANAEIQSQLGTAQTSIRQLEALLKRAETAKTKAIERQQVEQGTLQNWKELSEGHQEESNRLKEQLEESMTNAASLQNTVHRLEQTLAETKDQLKTQVRKESASPSVQSQTSMTSKVDHESLRLLRKVRGETAQLVLDLDTAKNYPGDPWNLVECIRNMIAAIDQDLGDMLSVHREVDASNPIPDPYLPFQRNDNGLQLPVGLSRGRDPTPPLSVNRIRTVPSSFHRPLLPPGLAEPAMGRASPQPVHLPSPIGTGRPTKHDNGMTPSPTQAQARTVSSASPSSSTVNNTNANVDWSIWSKR